MFQVQLAWEDFICGNWKNYFAFSSLSRFSVTLFIMSNTRLCCIWFNWSCLYFMYIKIKDCCWIFTSCYCSMNLTCIQMSGQTALWACFLWLEEHGFPLTVIFSYGTMKTGKFRFKFGVAVQLSVQFSWECLHMMCFGNTLSKPVPCARCVTPSYVQLNCRVRPSTPFSTDTNTPIFCCQPIPIRYRYASRYASGAAVAQRDWQIKGSQRHCRN